MRYRQPSQLQEDRAVEASLVRENEYWNNVHFPPEWHAESKRLREEREAIGDTFQPWFEQPVRIARLLRWLVLMEETPESIPDFIESAETWAQQYEDMTVWEQT